MGTKDVFVQIEFDVESFTPLIKENEQTTKKTKTKHRLSRKY